jgi:hypothetical protein
VTRVMTELRKMNREAERQALPDKVKVMEVFIELKNGVMTQTPTLAGEG